MCVGDRLGPIHSLEDTEFKMENFEGLFRGDQVVRKRIDFVLTLESNYLGDQEGQTNGNSSE